MFYTLHIFASDQIKEEGIKNFSLGFLEQLASQKATFDFFWASFKQLFEKSRETGGKP